MDRSTFEYIVLGIMLIISIYGFMKSRAFLAGFRDALDERIADADSGLIPKVQLLLMARDKEQAELIQRVQELEDSRKALWDALIELERKTKKEHIDDISVLVDEENKMKDRLLALERKAEDSGRIQAGGGVNRMRALISEQGGVKDGMLPTGVIR